MTGASRRLGRAIALRLSGEGWAVGIHHRRDDAGAREVVAHIEAAGGRAVALQADLDDVRQAEALVPACEAALGPLGVLVNNAARFRRTPLDVLTAEDFDAHMRTNARAVQVLCQHGGAAIARAGGGCIVNLTDTSALHPWGTHIPYCASKAAVVSMTRGFARALAPAVRVNAVAPGAALPPEDAAQGSGQGNDALIAGHSGAEAIAAAVSLFVRGDYLTGVVLHVDGGRLRF